MLWSTGRCNISILWRSLRRSRSGAESVGFWKRDLQNTVRTQRKSKSRSFLNILKSKKQRSPKDSPVFIWLIQDKRPSRFYSLSVNPVFPADAVQCASFLRYCREQNRNYVFPEQTGSLLQRIRICGNTKHRKKYVLRCFQIV